MTMLLKWASPARHAGDIYKSDDRAHLFIAASSPLWCAAAYLRAIERSGIFRFRQASVTIKYFITLQALAKHRWRCLLRENSFIAAWFSDASTIMRIVISAKMQQPIKPAWPFRNVVNSKSMATLLGHGACANRLILSLAEVGLLETSNRPRRNSDVWSGFIRSTARRCLSLVEQWHHRQKW